MTNFKKPIAIRSKYTKIFYKRGYWEGTHFVTMDINNATQFEDSDELRREFTRNYPFELEFVSLSK